MFVHRKTIFIATFSIYNPVKLKRVGLASRVLFEKLEKNTHCFSFSVFLDIQPRPQGVLTGEEVDRNLGVAQPPKIFLTPKRDHAEIYTPKRDDEHPDPFPMRIPPRV